MCLCEVGYGGVSCQFKCPGFSKDKYLTNKCCSNNGWFGLKEGVSDPQCICGEKFAGDLCDNLVCGSPLPFGGCKNGGVEKNNACICDTWHRGKHCEVAITDKVKMPLKCDGRPQVGGAAFPPMRLWYMMVTGQPDNKEVFQPFNWGLFKRVGFIRDILVAFDFNPGRLDTPLQGSLQFGIRFNLWVKVHKWTVRGTLIIGLNANHGKGKGKKAVWEKKSGETVGAAKGAMYGTHVDDNTAEMQLAEDPIQTAVDEAFTNAFDNLAPKGRGGGRRLLADNSNWQDTSELELQSLEGVTVYETRLLQTADAQAANQSSSDLSYPAATSVPVHVSSAAQFRANVTGGSTSTFNMKDSR